MSDNTKHIRQYYQKVKSANMELTKKEAFKDLLNRLYFGDAEIQNIIEFKNDLCATFAHAKQQLAEIDEIVDRL